MSVRAPKSHGASIATHGTRPQAGSSQTATEPVLTPEILTLAAVVVLGAIMTVLDATTSPCPVIGGLLVDAISWRWIFFVNLPVATLAFLLAITLRASLPRLRYNGTHESPIFGARPSRACISYAGAAFFEFDAARRIARAWVLGDLVTLLAQGGLRELPEPGRRIAPSGRSE
jgi:MFS family permease